VTPLDLLFQHWSPRNVTSHHNDCLTKRVVGERAVGKQARKYSLIPLTEVKFVGRHRMYQKRLSFVAPLVAQTGVVLLPISTGTLNAYQRISSES